MSASIWQNHKMTDFSKILETYKSGEASLEVSIAALERILANETTDLNIDHDRERRTGHPEVIYGLHKTPEQICQAFKSILDGGHNALATRVNQAAYEKLRAEFPDVDYSSTAQTATLTPHDVSQSQKRIAIVSAGTSDLSVAEEAAVTASFFGNPVLSINDVGVAGIHRLFHRLEEIRQCNVAIVVAGMEGALPSVVAGLIDKPVIAVPTSVGYGAALSGLTALFGMLTSCAGGIAVVNIDNGFGAAVMANKINRL